MHVYLHVPFCARRCSYCDFAIAVRREVPSAAYADAILREWSLWQTEAVWDQASPIETIYFGGGTPSRISADAVARLLDRITEQPLLFRRQFCSVGQGINVARSAGHGWQGRRRRST